MVEHLKEKYLLFKVKKGSPEAIAEIFNRYWEKLYRFVYFRVGNKEEAEDLTASIFLQLQTHLAQSGNIKSISGLLYRIARNKVADFYRTKRPETVSIEHIITGEKIQQEIIRMMAPDQNKNLEIAADMRAVLRGLDCIKSEYREVILLHYINELSVKELAEALEKTENNIRVLLFRALGALREVLRQTKPAIIPKNDQQRTSENFKESTFT